MKNYKLFGAIASAALVLSACNPNDGNSNDGDDNQNPGNGDQNSELNVGRLALVGGALHGCSSMATNSCADWDTYRATELAHLTDEQIRVPVELGVSLTDSNIYDVIDDSSWDSATHFDDANEEILFALQATLDEPDYLYSSWDDFKTAYIEFGDTTVDHPDGGFVTGDDVWFSSSDAQWSTLARLELVDETFKYTVTGDKVDAVLAQQDIAAFDSDLYYGLADTLEDSIYADPVLQQDLIDYFEEINVVDATINGWKLFKEYLSGDEFDFLLATLDPEEDGTYVINAAAITTINDDTTVDNEGEGWKELNREDLVEILTYLLGSETAVTYASYSEMRSAIIGTYLTGSGDPVEFVYELGSDVWNALSGTEQNVVLQGLVDPLVDYTRPLEYVNLNDSVDTDTVDVINAIVSKAQGDSDNAPTVLVMTSSSNNSYDPADYYVEMFNQAGANAQWLPVDRAYQDARLAERCDLLHAYHGDYASDAHADLRFPDYAAAHMAACEDPQTVLDMIASADALFINGGGQRRSLDALMPEVNGERSDSPAMALIRERFEAGELLVGGTSAGTAVQGGGYLNDASNLIPMIDGGQPYHVIQTGYDEGIAVFEGGLGLFNFGITDTHFSERARETRLVKLAEQTDVQFGFGVDETTVLFVDKLVRDEVLYGHLSVLGKGGVFVTDLGDAQVASASEETLDISNVSIHYLNPGDSMIINSENGGALVELAGDVAGGSQGTVTSDDVMYQDNFRTLMTEFVTTGATEALGTSYEDDPTMAVVVTRTDDSIATINGDRASYTNLRMQVSPQ